MSASLFTRWLGVGSRLLQSLSGCPAAGVCACASCECGSLTALLPPAPRRVGKRLPASSAIRVIDFGSATFNSDYHSTIVSTRHYRCARSCPDSDGPRLASCKGVAVQGAACKQPAAHRRAFVGC